MYKHRYFFGNPFKIKHREHKCYKCQNSLSIFEHSTIVHSKSPEAKYYDFSISIDGGNLIGECEFIHKVFFCHECNEYIEFITQTSFEDLDIFIEKIKTLVANKGNQVSIKRGFETIDGVITEQIESLDNIRNLCLLISKTGKEPLILKEPMRKKRKWERPYYFKCSKRKIIDAIEKHCK